MYQTLQTELKRVGRTYRLIKWQLFFVHLSKQSNANHLFLPFLTKFFWFDTLPIWMIFSLNGKLIPSKKKKIIVQFNYSRLYLGIETVSCRLLLRMVRMEMDWDLKKWRQLFQVLMPCPAMPNKSTKEKNIMVSACWFDILLVHNSSRKNLCVVKGTK